MPKSHPRPDNGPTSRHSLSVLFLSQPVLLHRAARPLRPSLGATLVLHVLLRTSMRTPGLTHSWDTGVWKQGSEPVRRAAGIRLLPPRPLLRLSVSLPPTSNTYHLKTVGTGPGLDKPSGQHFPPAAPEKLTLVHDMPEDILSMDLLKTITFRKQSQKPQPSTSAPHAETCSLTQLPAAKPRNQPIARGQPFRPNEGKKGPIVEGLFCPGSHEPHSSPTAQ